MATATIVTLTENVVADLNKKSGAWSFPFQAVRKYQPKVDFEDTDQLHVQVFPFATRAAGPASRAEWTHEYDIDIVLHYRAAANAGEQAIEKFDQLQRLVEEIADYYKSRRTESSDCYLDGISIGGPSGFPYLHELIETQNQFVSGVRLTFVKNRDNDA